MRTEQTFRDRRGARTDLPRSKVSALITQHSVLCFVPCALLFALSLLGALLFALSFPAEAQQPSKTARIGILRPERPGNAGVEVLIEAFRRGLRQLGYVEGQNLFFEHRFAEGKLDRLPDLAAGLVRLKVDVIFAINTPAARAAKT